MKFDRLKLLKKIEESGLKNSKIAEIVGVHRTYLWMIKTGVREPSKEVLERLWKLVS